MSKIITANVLGQKIELICTVSASMKLGEVSGIANVAEWFHEVMPDEDGKGGNIQKLAERTSIAFGILANAAISKSNFEISTGLKTGEKKDFYPDSCFLELFDTKTALTMCKYVIAAISISNGAEIPEELEKAIDTDALEIEAEKKS